MHFSAGRFTLGAMMRTPREDIATLSGDSYFSVPIRMFRHSRFVIKPSGIVLMSVTSYRTISTTSSESSMIGSHLSGSRFSTVAVGTFATPLSFATLLPFFVLSPPS
uniref:(northern house mosquito) hypothetical protein n=1 Tax=Culex pipiens TaxID=7175 RepID=A0A8D8HXL3_CULPI